MGEPLSIHGAQVISGYVHLAVLAALVLLASRTPRAEDEESATDRIALMRTLLRASGGDGDGAPAGSRTPDPDATPDEPSSPPTTEPVPSVAPSSRRARPPARTMAAGQPAAEGALGAATFGIIGLLGGSAPADEGGAMGWGAPSSSDIGDTFASGDFGLSGIGESGGGGARVIGLGGIHALSRDRGAGEGAGGTGGWGLRGTHRVGPVVCGCDETLVNGRTPPEVIQRIVRENMGRFRYCYERALDRNPALQGRVATRFLIARDGSVAFSAEDPEETELPDADTVRCIVSAFSSLSFPAPEGGTVTVVYPLTLTPAE